MASEKAVMNMTQRIHVMFRGTEKDETYGRHSSWRFLSLTELLGSFCLLPRV